jgi:hypothetical protein
MLVDDPEFDRKLFPQLPRLAETRAETEEGRRLFAGSQVVRGRAAVRSRLLAELGRHEVFVFAGHAVALAWPQALRSTPRVSMMSCAPGVPGNRGLELQRLQGSISTAPWNQ